MMNRGECFEYTSFEPPDLEDSRPTGGLLKRILQRKKPEKTPGERPLPPPPPPPPTRSLFTSSPSRPSVVLDRQSSRSSTPQPPEDDTISDTSSILSLPTEVTVSRQNRLMVSIVRGMGKVLQGRETGRGKPSPLVRQSSTDAIRRYWMPDENCRECYECGAHFTTFRRRHHCRICGQIFCNRCSNQVVPGKLLGVSSPQRACSYCATMALRYAHVGFQGDLSQVSSDDYTNLMSDDGQMSIGTLGETESLGSTRGPGGSSQTSLRIPSAAEGAATEMRTDLGIPDAMTTGSGLAGLRRGSSFPELTSLGSTNRLFSFDSTATESNSDLRRDRASAVSTPMDEDSPRMVGRGLWRQRLDATEQRQLAEDSAQLKALWIQMTTAASPVQAEGHGDLAAMMGDPAGAAAQASGSSSGSGVPMFSQRYKLKLYRKVAMGCQMVDWMLREGKVKTRTQARLLGQTFLDLRLLQPIQKSDFGFFKDGYTMYSVRELSEDQISKFLAAAEETLDSESEPQWLKDIAVEDDDGGLSDDDFLRLDHPDPIVEGRSTFFVDKSAACQIRDKSADRKHKVVLHRTDSFGLGVDEIIGNREVRSSQFEEENVSMPEEEEEKLDQDEEDVVFAQYYKRCIREYLHRLVSQEVSEEHLPSHWVDILLDMARRVTEHVKPDVKNDHDRMDLRHYVKIKKIPDVKSAESEIFFGVCCSKNVAHKKMNNRIRTPQILLLASSIEYQRNDKKLASLEPQIMQEEGYLRNCVSKIMTLKPDILVVERTVSQLAQEFLLNVGITLIYNVKRSLMERISRMTQADLVPSVDSLVGSSRPRLGCCDNFRVQTFHLTNGRTKSLMFMEAFAMHYGCTVILRGGPLSELKRAKRVLHFLLLAYYNARREVAYAVNISLRTTHPSHAASDDLEEATMDDARTDGKRVKLEVLVEAAGQSPDEDEDLEDIDEATETLQQPTSDTAKRRSVGEPILVEDQSDPLQRRMSLASIRANSEARRFSIRDAISGRILNMSMSVVLRPPYLDGVDLENCALQPYFQHLTQFTFTRRLSVVLRNKANVMESELYESTKDKGRQPPGLMISTAGHAFLHRPLTTNDLSGQDEMTYVDFRSRGGILRFHEGHEVKAKQAPVTSRPPTQAEEVEERKEKERKRRLQWNLLDLRNHQKLSVLFTNYSYSSALAPEPCVVPWIVNMEFYGATDVTLGQFLEKYCFRSPYPCANGACDVPMLDHVRRFVHGAGAIHLILRRLERDITSHPGAIVMWSWCQLCKKVSRLMPMSTDSWHLSFAKFLDLHFNCEPGCTFCRTVGDPPPCPHSLHRDHYQYFGYKRIVASFKYSPINLYEVFIPPLDLKIEDPELFEGLPEDLVQQAHDAVAKYYGVYATVKEYIFNLEQSKTFEPLLSMLESHRHVLTEERDNAQIRCMVDKISEILAVSKGMHLEDEKLQSSLYIQCSLGERIAALQEFIVEVKRGIVQFTNSWNTKMTEFHSHEKKLERELKKRQQQSQKAATYTQSTPSATGTDNAHRSVVSIKASTLASLPPGSTGSLTQLRSSASAAKMGQQTSEDMRPQSVEKEAPSVEKLRKGHRRTSSLPNVAVVMKTAMQTSGNRSTLGRSHEDLALDTQSQSTAVTEQVEEEDAKEGCSYAVSAGILAAGFGSRQQSSDGSFVICDSDEVADSAAAARPASDSVSIVARSLNSISALVSGPSSNSPNLRPTIVLTGPDSPLDTQEDTASQRPASPASVSPRRVSALQTNNGGSQSPTLSRKIRDETDATNNSGPNSGKAATSSSSMRKFFTFLSSGDSKVFEEPFPASEHYTLPPTSLVPVVVIDEELASIIAYSLSSSEYEKKFKELESTAGGTNKTGNTSDSPLVQSGEVLGGNKALRVAPSGQGSDSPGVKRSRVLGLLKSSQPTSNLPGTATPAVRYIPGLDNDTTGADFSLSLSLSQVPSIASGGARGEEGRGSRAGQEANAGESSWAAGSGSGTERGHIEMQFADTGSNFYCKIYYANEFQNLRKLLMPQGEKSFIQSLSRSSSWAAKGGKSGSFFMKTKDDRFVIKQLSTIEMKTFHEISSQYFDYMNMVLTKKSLCALGKIVGIFRIGFTNSVTNSARRMDVLVMENLFYRRQVAPIFDLKGSLRNRLVNAGGREGAMGQTEGAVLLDQNFLRLAQENPLYTRWHAKTALMNAVQADSEFLSRLLIMDYSLVVGVDEPRRELVVGIIDYLRKFTFDKKIEMMIKKTVAGEGPMPTILTPNLYRERFLEQMDRYFLLSPDQWHNILDQAVDD